MDNKEILKQTFELNPYLKHLEPQIMSAFNMLVKCFENGGTLIVCGNGGSAGDADHIVGELMKGFMLKRKIKNELAEKLKKYKYGKKLSEELQSPLRAISLSSHGALMTALGNDINYEMAFAQQVLGYGSENDVLIGISTSGNSRNIVLAATMAKVLNMKVMGLTGMDGGELESLCDVIIKAPDKRTWAAQDMHSSIYHALCAMIEKYFWKE